MPELVSQRIIYNIPILPMYTVAQKGPKVRPEEINEFSARDDKLCVSESVFSFNLHLTF